MSEATAKLFHETYERLAPSFGYATRQESAVPWEEVPEQNRRLMIAVTDEVIGKSEVDKLLEFAWGIIANAYGGDWDLASEASGWKAAAERWRDAYHDLLPTIDREIEQDTVGLET